MSQPDLEFRTAWQRQDLNLQETAIDFWSSLGILPTQVNAQDRAQELCVVAYADDLVAGVSTAVVAELPQLRNRFAFMRCAVAPGRRGQHIATALTQQSARVLSSWSEANPDKVREYRKTARQRNPDTNRDSVAAARARRFGARVEPVKRKVIFERDNGICHVCGIAVDPNSWDLDHIVPLKDGGNHTYDNVAVSHRKCNRGRASRH